MSSTTRPRTLQRWSTAEPRYGFTHVHQDVLDDHTTCEPMNAPKSPGRNMIKGLTTTCILRSYWMM